MKFIRSAAIMLFAVISAPALAQNYSEITVAADSSSGTYNKMLGEIIGHCPNDTFTIKAAQGVTGGAPGNLAALMNNKANAAFLHSDVFMANMKADPSYAKYKVLVALYPEPIHVLALAQSKTKLEWSMSNPTGQNKLQVNSLADTRGQKVGAAGGGVYTARILMGQGAGGFEVVMYDSGKQVREALDRGDIAAAIFVGAAPLPNIEELDKNAYKLVPIGAPIEDKVKDVYRPVTINYPGLTKGPLHTLAPTAVIMTREFSTETRLAAQRNFRKCFYENLPDLKDTGSPNWQDVDPADHGPASMGWYEIPVPPATASTKH